MTADDRSTMDLLRGSRIMAYSFGFVCLVAGIALLAWPGRSVIVVARIIGLFFVVIGFGQAVESVTTHRRGSYWGILFVRGLINLGIGIALLFIPEKSTNVIVWLIALDFLITGALTLIVSFMVPKDMGRGTMIASGLISIGLGVAIFWIGADDIKNIAAVVIGIVLLLLAVVFLASGYQLSHARATLVESD